MYLTNSKPEMVSAFAVDDPHQLNNTVSVILRFRNGSTASINYFANGSSKMGKEYLEVFCNGTSAILDDFMRLTIYGDKKTKSKFRQNKGHAMEVKQFLAAVKHGHATPIPFDEIYWATKATFDIINSIKTSSTIIY